jgi:hypothetical protein
MERPVPLFAADWRGNQCQEKRTNTKRNSPHLPLSPWERGRPLNGCDSLSHGEGGGDGSSALFGMSRLRKKLAPSVAAEQGDELALDFHPVGAEDAGLEGRVRRLKGD